MNTFIHRILSHRTRSALSTKDELFRDVFAKRIVWLGEFHSEPRIVALQNELVARWAMHLGMGAGKVSGMHRTKTDGAVAESSGAAPRACHGADIDKDDDASARDGRPRLHVVMEHFSLEMQPLLDRFQSDPTFDVHDLEREYARIGTEGHSLAPHRGFLNFCRATTLGRSDRPRLNDGAISGDDATNPPFQDAIFYSPQVQSMLDSCCGVYLHGGFIPRPYAARWNKCPDEYKRWSLLEDEIASNERSWLPPRETDPAMRRALLFQESRRRRQQQQQQRQRQRQGQDHGNVDRVGSGNGGNDSNDEGGGDDAMEDDTAKLLLRGSPRHYRLVESLMSGRDLYTPIIANGSKDRNGHNHHDDNENDDVSVIDQSTPLARLYQAQLLKDHAMAYKLATLMLDHASSPLRKNDRYLIVAGYGHVKHYLGVPACLERYLRAECLYHPDEKRRELALDVLINLISSSSLSSSSSSLSSFSMPVPETSNGDATSHHSVARPAGQTLIGCQMLYETYLEEKYKPLMDLEEKSYGGDGDGKGNDQDDDDDDEDEDNDDDDDDDAKKELEKRSILKELYLSKTNVLDKLLLQSDVVHGPFLHPSNGIGAFDKPCADFLFVYDEDDENVLVDCDHGRDEKKGEETNDNEEKNVVAKKKDNDGITSISDADLAKAETLEAYESVGKTAHRKGNAARARAIMMELGYTQDDLDVVGNDDIYNFQGVANPNLVANIRYGDRVLDVGSGLGVDSFLAARRCGADGNVGRSGESKSCGDGDDNGRNDDECGGGVVIGLDLSAAEVAYARKRASERGCDPSRVQFYVGDAEKRTVNNDESEGVPSEYVGSFDVCISNGAFCLIPDKRAAFQYVYDALKSEVEGGGRMAISTTTIRPNKALDPNFEWPVCMRMFVHLDDLVPMLEGIGFKNVRIVDATSPLEGMELPEEEEDDDNDEKKKKDGRESASGEKRFKIHGKYAEHFKHLEKMDMDELCKVVTVYGEK